MKFLGKVLGEEEGDYEEDKCGVELSDEELSPIENVMYYNLVGNIVPLVGSQSYA